MEKATESVIYEPTKSELILLEVLCNPKHATKTVVAKCKVAGISRDTYYRAMNKDEFKELITSTSLDLVKESLPAIVKATIKYAINNSKCSNDRKMIMQMGGLHSDKIEMTEVKKLEDLIEED